MKDLERDDRVVCPDCNEIGRIDYADADRVAIRHGGDLHTITGDRIAAIAWTPLDTEATCRCGLTGVIALADSDSITIEHRIGQTVTRHTHVGTDLTALRDRIDQG